MRQLTGKCPNHCMTEPVASMTTMAPPTKMALSFWPGLNLSSTTELPPRFRSQWISSLVQRLKRLTSRRILAPHGPMSEITIGTGSTMPAHRWISAMR